MTAKPPRKLRRGERNHDVGTPGYDLSPYGVTPTEIVEWLRSGKRDVRQEAADLIDSLCAQISELEGQSVLPHPARGGAEP